MLASMRFRIVYCSLVAFAGLVVSPLAIGDEKRDQPVQSPATENAAQAAPADESAASDASQPRTRNFRFRYGATITELPAGAQVRVWLPVPPSDQDQQVESVEQNLPAQGQLNTETKYGNQMLYFEAAAPDSGKLAFDVTYRVRRNEVRVVPPAADSSADISDAAASQALSAKQRKLFLQPDALVPIEGKPLSLLEELALADDPVTKGRQLYQTVEDHMRYSKEGTGWGRGDSIWACDSRYGNCSDFHSLFISLARSQGLPSRFQMGFPLPPARGQGPIAGYHCWAHYYADNIGWVPVDISEADKHPELKEYYFGNLTEDRITFSTGRDLKLEPAQAGPDLNFFIYPYAEVNGEPYPREKIVNDFSYEDL